MIYLPRLLVVGCLFILLGSFILEKIGSHSPCSLCHYARWAYLFVAGTLLISLYEHKKSAKRFSWLKLFPFLGSLAGIFLSLFHSLLERKLIKVKLKCTSSLNTSKNLEALEDLIKQSSLSRCDEIGWSLFGVTLANINVVLFILLAMGCWTWLKKSNKDESRKKAH